MKTTLLSLCSLALTAGALQAQTLSFTSGVVSNYSSVYLTLTGPTNRIVQVERLNRTNQTWDVMGTLTLNSSGTGNYTSSLHEGIYGFFRARTTNSSHYSTNAYGAVAGYICYPKTMIGNMFAPTTLSNIISNPATTLIVWQYTTNGYVRADYDTDTSQWYPNLNIDRQEGFIVEGPTNMYVCSRYLVNGLFVTNTVTKPIPTNWSIQCSPLYKLTVPANWQVDEFNTNRYGGYSLLPVQSTGFNPQATISRMIDTSGNYWNYYLTNNVWQHAGTNIVVPIDLAEGFWVYKPTNATWSVNVPIWY